MHKSLSKIFLGSLLALAAMAGAPAAQYQPVPNFTGIGAGFNFRQAINQRFSGAQPIAPQIVTLPYASLPSEQDGDLFWCKDCAVASTCAGGGPGAWAFGSRGQWECDLGGSTNLAGYTGAVGITGNSANGSDAIANVNVNGVLNVKAYGAKGDCSTNDEPAIQNAINAACTAGSSASSLPAVYFPATPNSCYLLNQPIAVDCTNLHLSGAGPTQTKFGKAYDGPTFLIQNATGWRPPFLSSVSAAWAASTAYAQYTEIKDSNGNIEAATAAGTSGSGSHPTWPTSQGNTVTDGSVTWTLESIGTQLLTGTGSAWDAVACNGGNIAGPPGAGCTYDLSEASASVHLNGLSTFTVEATINSIRNYVGSYSPEFIVASQYVLVRNVYGDLGTFALGLSGANADQPTCWMTVGGTFQTITDSASISLNHSHHLACVLNSGTITLYLDGTSVASASVSGTLTSTNQETVNFMDNTGNTLIFSGYIDSVRLSRVARYTSNFTPPTAKFTNDGNTMALLNWANSPVLGTIEGQDNNGGTANVFLPVVQNGAVQVGRVTLSDFDLDDGGGATSGSGPGIWAAWAYGSQYDNLYDDGPGNGTDVSIEFYGADWASNLSNITLASAGAKYGDQYSIAMNLSGDESGISLHNINIDGDNLTTALSLSSAAQADSVRITDRGNLVYPFVLGGGVTLTAPFIDSEGNSSNLACDVYSNGAWAPNTIVGGELDMSTSVSGAAYLCINGGKPIIDSGTSFGGNATTLLKVVSSPSSPVVVRDASYASVTSLTNSGESQWLALNPPIPTVLSGSAGTSSCTEMVDDGGIQKTANCYLNAYQETGTAQTFTFPIPFVTAPNVLQACGSYSASATATTLTLPANASMTAETCNVTAVGQ